MRIFYKFNRKCLGRSFVVPWLMETMMILKRSFLDFLLLCRNWRKANNCTYASLYILSIAHTGLRSLTSSFLAKKITVADRLIRFCLLTYYITSNISLLIRDRRVLLRKKWQLWISIQKRHAKIGCSCTYAELILSKHAN